MYRPKEVTERLGVSSATLRRWSDTFTDFLSPTAGKSITETGGPAQRRYNDQDVIVLATVKRLLDDGNTYEEVARKLPESILSDVVAHNAQMPVPLTEAPTSGSLVALEAYREAIAGKDQTIQALQHALEAKDETIRYQHQMIEELREHQLPPPISPGFVTMTFRQRLDWLIRGRMIGGTMEKRLDVPEGPSQRSLPIQEPA